MHRIAGAHGQVLADPTGGATPVAVANLNKWDLNLTTDKIDVTAFGDTNKTYVQGLPDIKGTVAGFWAVEDTTIFDIALGTVACALKLLPSSLETTTFFAGKAWLDASISVDSKGAVTIGGNFVAAGPWALTNP
jgi:hypothetical protein